MGLGTRIVRYIENSRQERQLKAVGPIGDYHRAGGNALLYDVPVNTGDVVIDAGGYEGEWSAGMLARYGVRSEIFEPVPAYAAMCNSLFSRNALVRVHAAALGANARETSFSFSANGTSEFIAPGSEEVIRAQVLDVAAFLDSLGVAGIGCVKLNIEGGEYEVLERLLESNWAGRCRSFLIQFHRQPEGWEPRYRDIQARLKATHTQAWAYPMVWEKWVRTEK